MTSRPSGFHLTKAGRLRLYSTQELLRLPPPEWLVDRTIPSGGLVGLYAPPETYKSFVAIDLAMSVATGLPWQGRHVRPGYVIYIAAEGGIGITKRVDAWLRHHDVPPSAPNIAWLTETVSVNNDADDLEILFARIDQEIEACPSLIIIDTLARCFDGNENEQQDMGRFVAGVDRMRVEYGATVVIIHHTNVSGTRERGNTAFRGAADTMIVVRRNDETGTIQVECDKQKDAEHFEPMNLGIQLVAGTDSMVLVPAEQTKTLSLLGWLQVGPLSYKELKARCEEPGAPMSVATLKRRLASLRREGKIVKNIEDLYEIVEDPPDSGLM